jgi:hypothetical protein
MLIMVPTTVETAMLTLERTVMVNHNGLTMVERVIANKKSVFRIFNCCMI